MKKKAEVNPKMLEWAIRLSGKTLEEIGGKNLPHLQSWLAGEKQPTSNQLKDFAKKTYISVPLLFLDEPLEERIPIKDFRLLPEHQKKVPTRNILDTIYDCQNRQIWYADYCRYNVLPEVGIVGKFRTSNNPAIVAQALVEYFSLPFAKSYSNYVNLLEKKGVLVMCSGVVAGKTHRPLKLEDMLGFALPDKLAPVIFINGRNTENGRKFTLMHELAHLAIGSSALSNGFEGEQNTNATEKWCNQVAAEILVPLDKFKQVYNMEKDFDILSKYFKISKLMIMLRAFELGYLKKEPKKFWQEYRDEKDNLLQIIRNRPKGGGNYYSNIRTQNSKRFCDAITTQTLSGISLYTHGMRLLNMNYGAFIKLVETGS